MSFTKAGCVRTLLSITAALAAASAHADSGPSVTVIPLCRSAAFEIRLDLLGSGQWDGTGHATLQWRKTGDTAWKSAQEFQKLVPDPQSPTPTDPRMGTMLFGLREGEKYDYRITMNALGYAATPLTGSFTELTDAVPAGNGKTIPIGPNTTDIRAAIKAGMGGDGVAAKGTTIEFSGNVDANGKPVPTIIRRDISNYYSDAPFNWSGTTDGYLTLKVKDGHDVTFDGSDAAFDVKGAGLWEPVPDGTVLKDYDGNPVTIQSSDKIYRTKAPVVYDSPVMAMYYETVRGGDAWRLYWMTAVPAGTASKNAALPEKLRARWENGDIYHQSTGMADLQVAARGNTPGYVHYPDGRLYVHLHDGVDPETVYIKIPRLTGSLDIAGANNLRVMGLKFQYFTGHWQGAAESYQYDPSTVYGGLHMETVNNLIIENCVWKGVGAAIGSRVNGSNTRHNVIIKGNTISQRGLAPEYNAATKQWSGNAWAYVKMSIQEQCAISVGGRGISILDNNITGWNDGVEFDGWPSADYSGGQRSYAEGVEVDNNTFDSIVDDAFEPLDFNVCVAGTRNTFVHCYKGCSSTRIAGGPIYFLRNKWLAQGEYAGVADKQAPTKLGNDNYWDHGYKLFANNSFVSNDPANRIALVGISCSGANYNTYVYNNYIACDAFPVDWAYGGLGYPHIFDFNAYYVLHPGSTPNYSDSYKGLVSAAAFPVLQGDGLGKAANGTYSSTRKCASFQSWQLGKNDGQGDPNWPGYDGTVPQTPRTGKTLGYYVTNSAGATASFDPQTVTWLHDPHSYYLGNASNDLISPTTGDFRPAAGSRAARRGTPMANITTDCGPGWAAYEESGSPTIGALPSTQTGTATNLPPVVSIPNVTATMGAVVAVPVTYSDADGIVANLTAAVADAAGHAVNSTLTNPGTGTAAITFTPAAAGTYTVSANATDNMGAVGSATAIATIAAPAASGGLVVGLSASKTNAAPGEPVVYTIACSNPTTHAMKNAVLNQTLPAQVTVNTASATLDGQPVTVTVANGTLTAKLGDLAPGGKHTLMVTAFIN